MSRQWTRLTERPIYGSMLLIDTYYSTVTDLVREGFFAPVLQSVQLRLPLHLIGNSML